MNHMVGMAMMVLNRKTFMSTIVPPRGVNSKSKSVEHLKKTVMNDAMTIVAILYNRLNSFCFANCIVSNSHLFKNFFNKLIIKLLLNSL